MGTSFGEQLRPACINTVESIGSDFRQLDIGYMAEDRSMSAAGLDCIGHMGERSFPPDKRPAHNRCKRFDRS